MKRSIQFFCVSLAIIAGVLYFARPESFDATVAHASSIFSPADTGKFAQIKIDEDAYDFHEIVKGVDAAHTFVLKNVGNDTLHITEARASCGCTAAEVKNAIAPGDTAHLEVVFHSALKGLGPIVKTVSIKSNSRTDAMRVVRISCLVVESKQKHKDGAMHLDGVFQGDCAKCHVDKGKGELGARLFDADCGVCHGSKIDSKPGAELASDEMMKHTPKEWKKIITSGIPNSNMPAFHVKNKGPLNDIEIASLVDYMTAYKKELLKQKKSGTIQKASSTTTPAPAGKAQPAKTNG